jgi:hypothetical protein
MAMEKENIRKFIKRESEIAAEPNYPTFKVETKAGLYCPKQTYALRLSQIGGKIFDEQDASYCM